VDDGLRGDQEVGEGMTPDMDETLDVGADFGTQIADRHGHVAARYVGDAPRCLSFSGGSFSGGYGTIAL
jgi:hypothetical protein